MCFCFTSNENATFRWKNGDLPKRVIDFLREKTHSKKKWKSSRLSSKIKNNNNGKPWTSSKILRAKPNVFMLSFFLLFHFSQTFSIFSCFFSSTLPFFHFSIFNVFFIFSCLFCFIFFIFLFFTSFFNLCDLKGARLNFQTRKLWLVGRCRDRPSRALPLTS